MTLQDQISTLLKTQARIDSKLTALLNKPVKQTWVRVSFITELTGWNGSRLSKAREQGIITYRDGKNGREYLLESLPEQFIITRKAV